MSRRFGIPVLLAALLALGGTSVATQQRQFPPGFIDPKPILDAAVKAIGADQLKCVTISGGKVYSGAVGQQVLAGASEWPRIDQMVNYTRVMNWDARTMKEEFDRKPGLAPAGWKYGTGWVDGPLARNTHQVFMLNASGEKPYAWHMDGAAGEPMPNEPDVAEIYPVELWMNPHGFLKAAQLPGANPKATWRWELAEAFGRYTGPTTLPEKTYVVQITAPGGFLIDATFDSKDYTVRRLHTKVADPVLGDLNYEHEFVFGDPGESQGAHDGTNLDVGNGIKFPTGWHSHQGFDDNFGNFVYNTGHNVFGGLIPNVQPNVCPDPVTVPASVRNARFPSEVDVERLAEGVYSMGIGPNYKSVVVEFPKYVVVFEAPRNEDFSLRVIEAIVKQIPNKPIRFLVNSHQHSDAMGGLRAYVHIGATIITQFLNFPYYNRDVVTYQPHTVKPDMVSRWLPTEISEGYNWEVVRENYTLEDAGRLMKLYYFGPSRHVRGMLIAYLPKEKMLIQSDIVNTNNPLPAVPTPDHQALYTEVRNLGLDVEQIVPIHGKPIRWSEFVKLFGQRQQTARVGN